MGTNFQKIFIIVLIMLGLLLPEIASASPGPDGYNPITGRFEDSSIDPTAIIKKQGGGGFLGFIKGAVEFASNPYGTATKWAKNIIKGDNPFVENLTARVLAGIGEALRQNLINKLINEAVIYVAEGGDWTLDFGREIKDTANAAVEKSAEDILGTNFCNPLTANFVASATISQTPPPLFAVDYAQCTTQEKINNINGFIDSFEGGWDNWIKISDPKQNPYGAYLLALDFQAKSKIDALNIRQTREIAGGGFLGDERIFKWHFKSQSADPVPGIACPDNSVRTYDDQSQPVACNYELNGQNGLRINKFEEWKKDPSFRPDTCNQPGVERNPEKLNCSLVIDKSEIVTPGSSFGNLAANLLYSDIERAQSSGDDFIKEATKRLVDAAIFRVSKYGLSKLGSGSEKKSFIKEEFGITSRKEWLQLESESIGQDLIASYENSILKIGDQTKALTNINSALNNSLDQESDIYAYQVRAGKALNDFKNCLLNVCLDNEYNQCDALYGQDDNIYDQSCLETEARPCLDSCSTKEAREWDNASWAAICSSDLNGDGFSDTYCKRVDGTKVCASVKSYCQKVEQCKDECIQPEHRAKCVNPGTNYYNCLENRWNFCNQQNPQVQTAKKELAEFNKYNYPDMPPNQKRALQQKKAIIKQELDQKNRDKLANEYWAEFTLINENQNQEKFSGIESLIAALENAQAQKSDLESRGLEPDPKILERIAILQTKYDARANDIQQLINKIEASYQKISEDSTVKGLLKWFNVDLLTNKVEEIFGHGKPGDEDFTPGKYHRYNFRGKNIIYQNNAGETICSQYEQTSSESPICQKYANRVSGIGNKCIPLPTKRKPQ